MNRPALITLSLFAVCLAAAWCVVAQHRQLAGLKDQKAPIFAQHSEPLDAQPALTSIRQESGLAAASNELLPLSSAIRRLSEREHELAGTPEENERLWKQFALQRAGAPAAPPEFIRKSEAQWVGTSDPGDTFQSALWALHHRQLDRFLEVLEPASADKLRRQIGEAPEKFFDAAATISAMRLSDQQFHGAATIKAQLDLGPDDPDPRTIFFFLLDGQWKMVLADADARFAP
jgi:hypothetical protein